MVRYFTATEPERITDKRYYNERDGWGTIKCEALNYYVVIFDKDPQTYEQIIKPEAVDSFYGSDKEYMEILKRAVVK